MSWRSATPSAKLPRAHGARVPRGYLAERRIEVRGLLKRDLLTPVTLQEQLDPLRAALMSGPETLYLPDERHLRLVQKDDNGADRFEQTWPNRIADISVDLITGDPYLYNDAESSDLGNVVDETPEAVTVNNADGNAPAAPELRLTVSGGGSLASIPASGLKGATRFTYTDGLSFDYACLNGDVMTVYIDSYGDLGLHPKIAGIVSPTTGKPDISNFTTNGQVVPTNNPPTYGILRSPESRNAQASVEAAIAGRRELLTQGSVIGSWSVRGDHTDLHGPGSTYLVCTDFTRTAFAVSGANAGVAVSATSTLMYQDSFAADLLEVKLIYSFQNAASVLEKTRVKVRVELRNPTASTLTGIKFAFAMDPNPNISSGVNTLTFQTPADLTAFAVQGGDEPNYIAIGVYDSGPNADGTRVGIASAATGESNVVSHPDTLLDGGYSMVLGSGTNATWYVGPTLTDTTTNYQTDNGFDANIYSASAAQQSLILRAPSLSITAGATQAYEFYLFTDINLTGADVDLDATVTNQTTGEEFTLVGSLPDASVIIVNTLDETVLVNDVDRTDLFDGLFPLLALGNNVFNIVEPNELITNLDVYWRSRWY